MDKHTLRVLEFDKILFMTAAFAVTAPGKDVVRELKPLRGIEEAREHIDIVSECKQFLTGGRSFGIEHFDDLLPLFRRIRPADAMIEPLELREFLPLFYSALNLKLLSEGPLSSGLNKVIAALTTHGDAAKAIEKAIDREGKVRDEASPDLSRIRKGVRSCEGRVKAVLEGILKQKDLAPHLQDFYLAERNNRWVIPVKVDSKGSVPGIIHDLSNTGETVYVEPYAVQQLSNELESFRAEEKIEVFRVLRRLASRLREHLHEIEEDYQIIARVDTFQALAGFSNKLDMSPPEIKEARYLHIIGGRHPLLWKTLDREGRGGEIVPLDIEIGRDNTAMVITGSNAGGKTVTLKTIGVLSLMALCGMHVPAASGTVVPFLDNVLADIGDEQSIEQNLSTFSAHVKRISEIIGQCGKNTLVIIDEFGTGTDPEQGSALSCAILRRLKKMGALSVVSTHLGMLKAFAHSEPGMINSAMEMEETTINGSSIHRPTYKLVVGEPGTSHAIEIAQSLGLDEDIIGEAREFLTGEGPAIESLINELKQKTGELQRRVKETDRLNRELDSMRIQLEEERVKIKAEKQKTISDALEEAEEIVRRTRVEAADIIRAMKKSPLPETRKHVQKLDNSFAEIKKSRRQLAPEKLHSLKEVREGQQVFITSLGAHGVVRSVNEKARRCTVVVRGREITLPFDALAEPTGDVIEQKDVKVERPFTPAADIDISNELKVIGQRVDPALSLIERYLNDASMAGLSRVKIIHGIGTGQLAAAIREFLKDHPLVVSSEPGGEQEGGEAVTVVFL